MEHPMRLSRLFSHTRREVPAAADNAAQQWLLRAGYLSQIAAGSYLQLPLGRHMIERLQRRMTSDLQGIGAQAPTQWVQEIRLPLLPPTTSIAVAAAQLSREHIHSYKQLPVLLFSFHPEWQNGFSARPTGLLRLRQQNYLRLFGFYADSDSLTHQYHAIASRFQSWFERCELLTQKVESSFDPENEPAHIYFLAAPEGDTLVFSCERCGYRAEQSCARAHKPAPPAAPPLAMEAVATPAAATIEALAQYLGIPTTATAKAVFYMMTPSTPLDSPTQEEFVLAIVRGDMEVNESKLTHALGAVALRPAKQDEICAVGATPGYASPVGLSGVRVVVDTLIPECPNLVAGANKPGYHLLNVNYGRDYQAQLVADITAVRVPTSSECDGDLCPHCQSRLAAKRGVMLGGSAMQQVLGLPQAACTYLNQEGKSRPLHFASHWLGMENLLASIAALHHDSHGLCLPPWAAPFAVHLVMLAGKSGLPQQVAESLAAQLEAAGIDVLLDDRAESPGIKFNDADLIGIPLRVTVSERSLNQGGVEIKPRRGEISLAPREDACKTILERIVES